MIISLRCENFRCFRDTEILTLAPLTILVGENNSGKSSILQALHLPALTLQSEDPAICLKLLHPDYDYGTFTDLVFQHDEKQHVTFNFETIVDAMSADENLKNMHYTLQLTYGYIPRRREIYLAKFAIKDSVGEWLVITQSKYSGSKKTWMRDYAEESRYLSRLLERRGFLFWNNIDPFTMYSRLKSRYSSEISKKIFNEMGKYFQIIFSMSSSFRKIHLLGPLRLPPRRIYWYSGEIAYGVGPKGEFALPNYAALLSRKKQEDQEKIDFINDALYQLGFIKELKLKGIKGRYYDIWTTHKDSLFSANLADTGFGSSQVLPVIVSLYTSPSGSTLLYEQPEIHLHPAAQAELGSVFVKACKRDINKSKRIVIETHSENLILRIRTEVAKGEINPEDVMIYYIEPNSSGHIVKRIPLDKKGKFQAEWPKGFFEEAYQESLELLKARGV